MAHFAKLDENNIVTNVIVVDNNELLDNGVESELKGIEFCVAHYGGVWKQTSYNGIIRKNYAGIGSTYDEVRDAFISPKPEKIDPKRDYILDETTCTWVLEEAVVEEIVVEVVVLQEEIPE
jgi:hypothetical protein